MVIATWDEMRNANKGQDMGSFPKNLARAAKDVVCDVNSAFGGWLQNEGINGPLWAPMIGDLCRRNPPPSNNATDRPFQGGQCAGVAYQAIGTIHGTDFNNNAVQSSSAGWSSAVPGPVTRIEFRQGVTPNSGGQSFGELWLYGTGGVPVRFANLGGAKAISGPSSVQVRRVDLQPDSCGDRTPPPVPVPPVGDIMRPVPVPTPTGPLIVPVVIPVGVFVKPTLQVNVGDININFDAGGITFSPTVNVNPIRPRPVEPSPTSPPAPPLPPARPPTEPDDGGGICPPCPDPCPDPVEFVNVTVTVTKCALDGALWKPSREDKTFRVLKGTEESVKEEYRQLLPLTWEECNNRNDMTKVSPELLFSGEMTDENRVFETGLLKKVEFVYLVIKEPIPPSVSLYAIAQGEDPNGKFGVIQSRYLDQDGGLGGRDSVAGFVWTTFTVHPVPTLAGLVKGVRIILRPGCVWELYDSGIRKVIKEPI